MPVKKTAKKAVTVQRRVKKVATKKAVAKKTITLRSKDGTKLAGSQSLEGKKVPTAKGTVKKAEVVKKTKTSTPQMIEIDEALNDEFIKDITVLFKCI